MFTTHPNPVQAYSQVGTASGAMSASPHGLVLMLYEGAQTAVAAARMHAELGQKAQRAQAISKAVAIIQDGLMASLDREAGGELAEQLFALYDYMVTRLIEANLHNRGEALEETGRLLHELGSAWKQIGKAPTQDPTTAESTQP